MAWNNRSATASSGAKLDGDAAAEIAKAEAAPGSSFAPGKGPQRSPGMAQHVADALRATNRQRPPGW